MTTQKSDSTGQSRTAKLGGIVIFDGSCGICTASAEWIKNRAASGKLTVQPYQTIDLEAISPGLTPEMTGQSVYFIRSDGRRFKEARAVFEILKRLPGIWHLLGVILSNPIAAVLCAPAYRWIARHRSQLSTWLGLTTCAIPDNTSS